MNNAMSGPERANFTMALLAIVCCIGLMLHRHAADACFSTWSSSKETLPPTTPEPDEAASGYFMQPKTLLSRIFTPNLPENQAVKLSETRQVLNGQYVNSHNFVLRDGKHIVNATIVNITQTFIIQKPGPALYERAPPNTPLRTTSTTTTTTTTTTKKTTTTMTTRSRTTARTSTESARRTSKKPAEEKKIWTPAWSKWSMCLAELNCREIRSLNWVPVEEMIVPRSQFNTTEFNLLMRNRTLLNSANLEERSCSQDQLYRCHLKLNATERMFPPARSSACGRMESTKSRRHHQSGAGLSRPRRIVGGSQTNDNDWPWLARLEISTLAKPYISCAASMISKRFFVTAGHCIANVLSHEQLHSRRMPEAYWAWQERDRHWMPEAHAKIVTPGGHWTHVKSFLLHPDFKSFFNGPDIAILELGMDQLRQTFVETVCLPDPVDPFAQVDTQSCYTAGWGSREGGTRPQPHFNARDSVKPSQSFQLPNLFTKPIPPQHNNRLRWRALREVRMPVTSLDACRRSYNTTNLHRSRHICVGARGYGTCTGDSGGGLYCPDLAFNQWHLVGVISFHHSAGCGTHESVMAAVGPHRHWITTSIINRLER